MSLITSLHKLTVMLSILGVMLWNVNDSYIAANASAMVSGHGRLSSAKSSSGGSLVTYWGQNGNEGSLLEACETGLYNIIILSFLCVFGNGATPVLNLAGHCEPSSGECQRLSPEIEACQREHGVKVLLSIGGGAGSYTLASTDDAHDVATYLWSNFLGGGGGATASILSRPLGEAVLDGIDMDIEGGGVEHYDDLARFLRGYSPSIVLTAAPQCPFPDAYMGDPATNGSALHTGLFDYVWVQFYNNPCGYHADISHFSNLFSAWDQWSSSLPPRSHIAMGLPASPSAAGSGFIPPHLLLSDVLPTIKHSSNYAGIMLWSYYYDSTSHYSSTIKSMV